MRTRSNDIRYTSVPIPKFFGSDSKSGFFLALVGLLPLKGAAAGFLADPALGALGWSLRRGISMSLLQEKAEHVRRASEL